MRRASARAIVCSLSGLLAACSCEDGELDEPSGRARAPLPPESAVPAPELLYVPSAEELLPPAVGGGFLPGAPPLASGGRCPPEMVDVRSEFCIDRFEAQLFDARRGEPLSPYFHPTRAQTAASWARYRTLAARSTAPAVPAPPAFQLEHELEPVARSVANVVPSGYLSGVMARAACERAGKRLCTRAEWLTACRGEDSQPFPYGAVYERGACNVHRDSHPAALLHGNPSRHHLDPRLNRQSDGDGPLLRPTGSLPRCRSRWGADGVFDMVGNLDEWTADGAFLGGFYARGTRDGCEARISSHPPEYFDYSLGTRCCR